MSTERVVFKQRYRSRNKPDTKILNQKHLIYIATRPGVMKNQDCGFGLWGKLPDARAIGNINDLRHAQRVIGAASEQHTIYRAVLSVSKETAREYNLYEREEWEKLLRARIGVIRTEMHIKPENFHWVAAMHYKKNHPHVHIMYWDGGKEPKREFIDEKRFEELSASIRFAFAGKLSPPEVLEAVNGLHNEADAALKETRRQLAALLKQANLADALNLDRLKPAQCTALGGELLTLAVELPNRGSLKYDYLPTRYKEKLNAYLENVLTLSDFSKLNRQYLQLKEEVSRLYGNTPEMSESYQQVAHRAFLKALGNETLKYLKGVADELRAQAPPEDIKAMCAVTQNAARKILRDSSEYAALLASLPPFRTPLAVLLKNEQFKKELDALAGKLTRDVRIRSKADGLLRASIQQRAKEEAAQERKNINRALYGAMRETVWNSVKADKGYDDQRCAELALMGLLQAFRGVSQEKNQLQTQRDLQMEKLRNLSEAAKKDLRKQREQQGSWSPDV